MRVWPKVQRFRQDALLCHANEIQSTGYGENSNLSVRATKGSLKEKLLLLYVKYKLYPSRASPAKLLPSRG